MGVRDGVQTNGKGTMTVLEKERVLQNFRRFLSICGICIWRESVWKPYEVLMVGHTVFTLSALGYSFYFYLDNVDSLAVVIHHTMLVVDVLIGTVYFFAKRTVVRRLMTDMCFSYDYDSEIVSDFLRNLEEKRVKNMEFVFKSVVTTAVYMQINVIICGFIEKYTNDDLEFMLLFPCWFPFDLSYLPYHVLAYAWEHAVIEMIGLTLYGSLAFMFLVYSHLTTQLQLLNFAMERSKDRAYELVEKRKGTLRRAYILGSKMSAEHHLQIIGYYNDANGVFRLLYFMAFVSGLVICTCTGLALIYDNTSLKIKFVGVTIIHLVFLYILCWFGVAIAELNKPKECHSTFRLMVERTMRPLAFTTLTGQKVDLDNYMSLNKASYSYFNMMLATQEKTVAFTLD